MSYIAISPCWCERSVNGYHGGCIFFLLNKNFIFYIICILMQEVSQNWRCIFPIILSCSFYWHVFYTMKYTADPKLFLEKRWLWLNNQCLLVKLLLCQIRHRHYVRKRQYILMRRPICAGSPLPRIDTCSGYLGHPNMLISLEIWSYLAYFNPKY